MLRRAGYLIIGGVLVFITGVTRPVLGEFIGSYSSSSRIPLLEANWGQWLFSNVAMGLGSLIAALGIAIFVIALRNNTKVKANLYLGYISALATIIGLFLWSYFCYGRIAQPVRFIALDGDIFGWEWSFSAFTWSMFLGILLLGYVILREYSVWGGAVVLIIEVFLVSWLYSTTQDVIPAIHYMPLLIAGITLSMHRSQKRLLEE